MGTAEVAGGDGGGFPLGAWGGGLYLRLWMWRWVVA